MFVLSSIFLFLITHVHSQIPKIDIITSFGQPVFGQNARISPICSYHIRKLVTGGFRTQLWAIQMLDSSSKLPSGILKGNLVDTGNFDECLEIENNISNVTIYGKYCLGSVSLEKIGGYINVEKFMPTDVLSVLVGASIGLNLFPKIAVCVPSTCTAQDLQVLGRNFVNFEESECFDKFSGYNMDFLGALTILFFGIVLGLVVACTTYDLYCNYTVEVIRKPPLVNAFSLIHNAGKVFKTSKNNEQLQCLNGLKVLNMIWVVLGHVFMGYLVVPVNNYLDAYTYITDAKSTMVTAATFSVDSFFVISSFLTVYSYQKATDKKKKVNIYEVYLHRYLRLTPPFAIMIWAHATLFKFLGSGPYWPRTEEYLAQACKDYWWSALLYLQNYVNPTATCVPQSWYLSVEMQMFILSPLILIPLRKHPFWTVCGTLGLIVASMSATFAIGWIYSLKGTLASQLSGDDLTNYLTYYYFPLHTRMTPYLIGILLGHFYHYIRKSGIQIKLRREICIGIWTLVTGVLLTCIFIGHEIEYVEYNKWNNAIYLALARPVWSIAISWVIFACLMDLGGPVNTFLSLPVFQIASKFSYSIYLVHYAFIYMTNFTKRQPLHFTPYEATHKFFGDLIFSTIIAIFYTLIIESPIVYLEKMMHQKSKVKKEASS